MMEEHYYSALTRTLKEQTELTEESVEKAQLV